MAKDRHHYVFSLKCVDDDHGDAVVVNDVKRMMDQLLLEQKMNDSDVGKDLNVEVGDISHVVVSNVVGMNEVAVVGLMV